MDFILKSNMVISNGETTATTENEFDCNVNSLIQYCVCPPLCADVGKCPCKFPGSGETINPRPYKFVPIAPYCSCPVAKCFVKECPAIIEICTADFVQHLID